MQFPPTNTCLFDQFTLLSVGTGSTYLKQILKQRTRCKISITTNNLLYVLWKMLEASNEIDRPRNVTWESKEQSAISFLDLSGFKENENCLMCDHYYQLTQRKRVNWL